MASVVRFGPSSNNCNSVIFWGIKVHRLLISSRAVISNKLASVQKADILSGYNVNECQL